jgi:hypothetical protein
MGGVIALTTAEQSALSNLGIRADQANSLDKENLKAKLQEVINQKIDPKIQEIKDKINNEKQEVESDAKKLAAGYLASTVSLFAATLIGPQVIMVCKTKPSAVIYAGSAALYIVQEIANIKVLKASQLAEIEVVDNLKIDQEKSYKENVADVKNKVDLQVGYLRTYKKTLDDAFSALKKKAKNAKIVSAGFLASSAAAAAEQMNWISGGGTCVASHEIKKDPKEYLVFSSKLDDHYKKLIEEAKTPEDKWANYYEWESYKFGASRSLSWDEYARLKNIPGPSHSSLTAILNSAIDTFETHFVSNAFAGEKVTVAASLKNNKAADWYGDLDKLGIVGGAAINIVAYMAGWQLGFLKNIIASGTSRAVTFGAQAAIAFTAGKLFDDAANGFIEKMKKVDRILDQMDTIAKKGLDLIVPSDSDARRFQEIATKLGVPSTKLITDMSIREARAYIDQIKETASDKLSDIDDSFLNEYSDKLEQKAQELAPKIESAVKASFLERALEPFMSSVSAAVASTGLNFPRANHPNLKGLNRYLDFYEGYSRAVMTKNTKIATFYERKILRHKSTIAQFRNNIFMAGRLGNYSDLEKQKVAQELGEFESFYRKLPEKDQSEFMHAMDPLSDRTNSTNASLAQLKMSPQDKKVLINLLRRLNEEAEVSSSHSGPAVDMSFTVEDRGETVNAGESQEEYKVEVNTIHPKEVELFEIIHSRYIKHLQE